MDALQLPNETLSKHLSEIAELYRIENDTYRYKVFNDAAPKIEIYPDEIISGQDAKNKIGRGIGPSIMEVVDEFLNTGTSKRLEDLKNKHIERSKIINEFMTIHGIGPVNANKFYDMGFRTLDDLWYHADLTKAQRITIYYRDHLSQRIPRDEIDWFNKYLHLRLSSLLLFNRQHQIEIVGSYRREEASSGDIDVLIRQSGSFGLNDIVDIFKKDKLIIDDLALGESKYLGLLRIGERPVRRLDLLIIAAESWTSALLYFTGSQRFNILMRQRAKDLNMRLNEYGLYNSGGGRLITNTEKDIFDLLSVRYLDPKKRTRNLVTLEVL